MRSFSSYQGSLTVKLIGVATLPLLLFGFLAATIMVPRLKTAAEGKSAMLARTMAKGIETYLGYSENDLRLIAESLSVLPPSDANRISGLLSAVVQRQRYLETLWFVDSRGVLAYSSNPNDDFVGLSLRNHPLLKDRPRSDEIWWSPTYLSGRSQRATVTVSLSYRERILVGFMNLVDLDAYVQQGKAAELEGQFAFVVDRRGVVLSHPDISEVAFRVNRGDLSLVRKGLEGRWITETFEMGGTTYIGSVAPIAKAGWALVVAHSMDQAYAAAYWVEIILGLATLLGLSLAIGLSLFSSQRVMRPLRILTAYTERVAAGNYAEPPQLRESYREFLALSSGFRSMVEEIQNRESLLESSREQYSGLLERLNEAVFSISLPGGRYMYFSRAAEEVFGYRAEEFLKRPLLVRDIIHPTYSSWFEIEWKKTLDGEVSPSWEYKVIDKGRAERWIFQTNTLVFDTEGRAVALEGCCTNVTSRKNAETELQEHRLHLERLVEERTAELVALQTQLLKRERLATLGQLTATVSHEIRNPLGAIRTSTYYLLNKDRILDEKLRKHLSRIEAQVAICDSIVRDLLEFTKDRPLEKRQGNVREWVNQWLKDFPPPAGVKVYQDFSEALPLAQLDTERMKRAFANVLQNAYQAVTAQAEHFPDEPWRFAPTVTIKLFGEGRGRLTVVIEDNGVGMDEKTAQRAFEPLFTTRATGTGLGLAIVRKTVEEHGGTVTIASKKGEGTRVTMTLPI